MNDPRTLWDDEIQITENILYHIVSFNQNTKNLASAAAVVAAKAPGMSSVKMPAEDVLQLVSRHLSTLIVWYKCCK